MGIDNDPLKAVKSTVLNMISELVDRGFSKEEVYVLCSVAGNLKMSEVVDEPNYIVTITIPENIIKR